LNYLKVYPTDKSGLNTMLTGLLAPMSNEMPPMPPVCMKKLVKIKRAYDDSFAKL